MTKKRLGSGALKEGSSKLRKITSKGQVSINNISENEAQRRALEDASVLCSNKGRSKY